MLTMTYNEIMYPLTYFNFMSLPITYNGTSSVILIKIPLKIEFFWKWVIITYDKSEESFKNESRVNDDI